MTAEPGAHGGVGQWLPSAAGETMSGSKEIRDARSQGFGSLRFDAPLEERYQKDTEAERLGRLRLAALSLGLGLNCLLPIEWLMVPDQFVLSVFMRTLVGMPLALFIAWRLSRLDREARERLLAALLLFITAQTVQLCVRSHGALGAAYLTVLAMVMLLNASLVRLRFRMAVLVDLSVLVLFAIACLLLVTPPWAVLCCIALVLVSCAIFCLFSTYRSEYEERYNWLMRQQQESLREAIGQTNRQLAHLSRFDPLTDLANRRHFDEFLAGAWQRARHQGQAVALLMIDIDHFKAYNDHHGHAQGDLCIQAVASVLTSCLRRPEDLVARYGGEEFAVVMPGASIDAAVAAAERIRSGLAAMNLPHAAPGAEDRVTVSIGAASLDAKMVDGPAAVLVASADVALYQAKEAGRDRVVRSVTPARVASSVEAAVGANPQDVPEGRDAHLRGLIAQALARIDRPLSPMLFPPELEQRFDADLSDQRARYFAICGLIAFVVFNGFLLTDYLLVRDVFWLAVKVRLGVFTPAAAGVLLVLWFARKWVVQRWPAMVRETVVLLSGVAAAASLGYILSASHLPTSQLYHAGFMVVIIYGNMVQRLRFWYAVIFSLMVYALHIGAVCLFPAFNERLTFPLLALIGATVIFSLLSNYVVEREERRRYLLTLSEQSALAELYDTRQQLQRLSRMDALTGLYNRRHFQSYLQQVWQRAQHDGSPVAIIMMDVDDFKAFNDRYGHQAGDVCLAKVAEAMKSSLRQPGDLVARFGGEEFIAVLPMADARTARDAAERVRHAVQGLALPHAASRAASVVTVSLGVASVAVQPGMVDAALIRAADEALYEAKRNGRNRVAAGTAS